jgi:plastocyanin
MRRSGAQARIPLLAAAACAAAIGVGGCGLTDSGDNVVNGKEQFVAKCGSCHTLARAGTRGVTGPNLDQAFQRAREDGFGEGTFQGIVHKQILHPALMQQVDPVTGKLLPLMPANLVTGQDAADVAAYVAQAASQPGEDSGRLATVGAAKAEGTAKEENGKLSIPADPNGSLVYQYANAEASPGQLTIESPNESSVDHDISLEGNGVNERGEVVRDGGVSKIEVDVDAGDYTFYCSVQGHRQAGMEGKLTVK